MPDDHADPLQLHDAVMQQLLKNQVRLRWIDEARPVFERER
jgi:hypothetical protein